MDRKQSFRTHATAQDLPGEVLERVLAHVPFRERVQAAAVCRAWHQHLSQRGLLLWQAATLVDCNIWKEDLDQEGITEQHLRLFLSLQRWLWRHGGNLLQLQCNTSFHDSGTANDGLLAAFLATLAAAAPSLQALRLDKSAMWDVAHSSLMVIAGMGSRLRQLALIGVQAVTEDSLSAALAQLPKLQDLAVLFEDEAVREEMMGDTPQVHRAPDMMRLLGSIATSCPELQTLALGHLPVSPVHNRRWSPISVDGQPLPATMSRLSALTSLTLQNVGWDAPGGLPHLPQLRRLNLRGNNTQAGPPVPRRRHQLSTLTALEALQVMLPYWPGRLPHGLTQLVVAPLEASSEDAPPYAVNGIITLRNHLPPLRGLRHLALHGLKHFCAHFMNEIYTAAGALPQLISLHLVNCNLASIPSDLCELSRLQLLSLSGNWMLQQDGYSEIAHAPLHKLASCRQLDLRTQTMVICPDSPSPPRPDTLRAIARMPALEQLALPFAAAFKRRTAADEEAEAMLVLHGSLDGLTTSTLAPSDTEAQLAQQRGAGMPSIHVVTEMPDSDRWAAVDTELPFVEVSDMLGVQLDRSVARGVLMNS